MLKKDDIKTGLLIGLLAPFIGMFGFYFLKFRRLTIIEFMQWLGIQRSLLTAMISFSLLANAIVFTIYINKHIDKTARGIFITTIVWVIAALILKWMY
ncbi:MAG: hypothetical protein JST94_02400 [Bacteroidetes bacterium]|nr:hypothetical protein [Bacteroidota bacterium]MBS1642806.1 hypothetical protein [Bacteroidota bacterium]MBS1670297.1 hypothetical protein [Bacteroidota bacterium]